MGEKMTQKKSIKCDICSKYMQLICHNEFTSEYVFQCPGSSCRSLLKCHWVNLELETEEVKK